MNIKKKGSLQKKETDPSPEEQKKNPLMFPLPTGLF